MKTAKKNRASSSLELVLPATSANLGPAFDAAALAFRLFLKIRAVAAQEFSISARGRDADICGRVENHLILTTYREVLQDAGKPVQPLFLKIDTQGAELEVLKGGQETLIPKFVCQAPNQDGS